MFLLDNKEVAQVLDMQSCVKLLEEAARAIGTDEAVARPATTLVMPKAQPSGVPGAYQLQSREGVARPVSIAACRLMSDNLVFEPSPEGSVRRKKIPAAAGKRYVGLIFLFDTDTSELMAMFPDAEIQRRRVAGTGAVASKYISRADACTLGILGSGWQAEVAVLAHCLVRNISRVRVYSPTREHREALCARMSGQVNCVVEPVASAAEAIKQSDVIVAITDAIGAVIDGALLRPGTHVTLSRYFELDEIGWKRCDVIVEGTRPEGGDPSYWSKQIWDQRFIIGGREKVKNTSLAFRSTDFTPTQARHVSLPDLVLGQAGRQTDKEISCFYISNPSGVQLAYLGGFIVKEARRLGLGRDLPAEWFSEAEKD
jgi:alanine dehydrogenase